ATGCVFRIPRTLRYEQHAPPIPYRNDVGGSETCAAANGVAAFRTCEDRAFGQNHGGNTVRAGRL
ncbi:hypothetical protein, partial [Ferrovum myxofaciens]|uniref:hypothetical protein n=1 Tax=Ferrovum myxofaciens TaxID=416213 RepID=UPI001D0D529C